MTVKIDGSTGVDTVQPASVDKEDLKWVPPFTKEFVSPEQTITLAGALTLAHGLGTIPKLIQVYAICKIAEQGYSIGDLMTTQQSADTLGTVQGMGLAVVPDAANINIRIGNANFTAALNKSTGALVTLTSTSWRLIVRAWA